MTMFYPVISFPFLCAVFSFHSDIVSSASTLKYKHVLISFCHFHGGTLKEHDTEMHSVDFIGK